MARYDALVVGAGPAGSVAALVLARSGARVGLIDSRRFPRDKACGDLVGPRGVALLSRLGLAAPEALQVGDMHVVGPSGRSVRLPALPGLTYPGWAHAVPRTRLDAYLRDAAVAAGAIPIQGRVTGLEAMAPGHVTVRLSGGQLLDSEVLVGADGAVSPVAASAGLLTSPRTLWGFALRCYVEADVDLPTIVLWEPRGWRLLPGYGWLFPAADGGANLGLGCAVLGDRSSATRVMREVDGFVALLQERGLLPANARPGAWLGGWLRFGGAGTVPADGGVLLVGDAAGLVNPLQGEGIAYAMASGHAAAAAVVQAGPGCAAARYRNWVVVTMRVQRRDAALHRLTARHPWLVSLAGRLLTTPPLRNAVAGAWGLYWNELVDGAAPSHHRTIAKVLNTLATTASSRADQLPEGSLTPDGTLGCL